MKTFKPLIVFGLAALVMLSLSRALLVAWQFDRLPDTGGVLFVLLQGIRFDLVLLGMLLGLPAMLAPLVSLHRPLIPAWNRGLRLYLVACFAGLLFMELATPAFVGQYDLRPNYLFIEYLKYPREVFSTLWAAYRWPLLAVIATTAVVAYAIDRLL
jgi:phosphoglycerol transferase MdoB-like AlkP superfamily enzyme